jgi:hypothetical protein
MDLSIFLANSKDIIPLGAFSVINDLSKYPNVRNMIIVNNPEINSARLYESLKNRLILFK